MKFDFETVKKIMMAVAVLPLFAVCVACGENPEPEGNGGNGDEPADDPAEKYEDIKVVDGKVRFYLSEKADATRTATNMTARDWAKSKVEMNGKTYTIDLTTGETPRPYVEVDKADEYTAVLVTPNSKKWDGSALGVDVKLPYSQFYHTAIANIKSFPMYASYSKQTGNKLIFNDAFAMVYVRLKGEAKISSVKIDSPTGRALAGLSSYLTTKNEYVVKKGMPFAVLNCTNEGNFVQLSKSKYTNFRVMVAPGIYSKGLEVSVCDSDRGAKFFKTEPLTLTGGDVHVIEADYACEDDLAFYEGFDNFVWGGDIMKGSQGFGFAPTDATMAKDSGAELTGYEDAFAEVAYNNPGSGFIQPNVWDQVTGKTVGEAHFMSDSYVKSRNIADWSYLYRAQEFPGYIASGAVVGSGRGVTYLPQAINMKGIGDAAIKIRFGLQNGFTGGIEFMTVYSGVIKSAKINGQDINLTASNTEFRSETAKTTLAIDSKYLIPASESAAKQWNELEVIVSGVTDGTRCYFQNNSMSGSNLGIYLDKVEIRKIKDWKDDSNLRVLLWNIQNGMIADQHNNYDNFVAWVKKYDPDICIWCESESIYKDKSGSSSGNNKYLPDGWVKLCTRYGHTYAAVGGNRDNYPQTVTSKYPIKTIKKITDTNETNKPVSHGAGHFQIEVHGKKINIVALHMWPQQYAYGVSSSNQSASAAAYEGDYYRKHEMQYIVDNTINLPANKGEEYWILGGDTNSNSRLDDWYTKYSTSSRPSRLITHDVILNQTDLKDVVVSRDCNGQKGNAMFRSRIDILYASPKMFDCITNSTMLMDSWCGPNGSWEYHDAFRDPSDHTPVIVEFKL
jgi:hypothetical protein